MSPGKASFTQELAAELDNKEAAAPRNNQAESSKRVHKRLYGIIAGLVLMLAVSMAGTFASSLVAIESAKDTVISADGAFVDKKTGALISTENPHFTTKAAGQVQALGLLSSEVNVTLRGQKSALHRRPVHQLAHSCDGSGRPSRPSRQVRIGCAASDLECQRLSV